MKKIAAVALSLILFIMACFPVNALSLSNEYAVGDVITLGSYPQTEVSDPELLSELNTLELEWIDYEYYCGNNFQGNLPNGSMKKESYFFYSDVIVSDINIFCLQMK